MPGCSGVWRLLPSAILGAASTTAAGCSTNELTGGGPSWWRAVLGVSLVGLVVAGLWAYWVQTHNLKTVRSSDEISPIDRSVVEGTVREVSAVQRRMDRAAHMMPATELAQPRRSETTTRSSKSVQVPDLRKISRRGKRSGQ